MTSDEGFQVEMGGLSSMDECLGISVFCQIQVMSMILLYSKNGSCFRTALPDVAQSNILRILNRTDSVSIILLNNYA